jgi:hypothetical protein
VELGGDHRILNEQLERDDFEGVLMCRFKNDRAGSTGLLDLEPACRTDTPAIARLEAGKAKLRHRCAEVVAKSLGRVQKCPVDDAADSMDTVVFGAGLATACAIEAGHRLAPACVERLAENVLAAVSDRFDGRHTSIVEPENSTADSTD